MIVIIICPAGQQHYFLPRILSPNAEVEKVDPYNASEINTAQTIYIPSDEVSDDYVKTQLKAMHHQSHPRFDGAILPSSRFERGSVLRPLLKYPGVLDLSDNRSYMMYVLRKTGVRFEPIDFGRWAVANGDRVLEIFSELFKKAIRSRSNSIKFSVVSEMPQAMREGCVKFIHVYAHGTLAEAKIAFIEHLWGYRLDEVCTCLHPFFRKADSMAYRWRSNIVKLSKGTYQYNHYLLKIIDKARSDPAFYDSLSALELCFLYTKTDNLSKRLDLLSAFVPTESENQEVE